MGCNPITRLTLRADRYEGCLELVRSGEFDNISETMRFAIRVYWDHLRREGIDAVPLVDRSGEKRLASVRLDSHVVEGLTKMRLVSKGDIGDYALDYYLNEYRRGIQRSESFGFVSTRNPDPSGMTMSSSRSTSTPTRLKNTAFLRSASVVRAMWSTTSMYALYSGLRA